MLQNTYSLAKIGADTAGNERNFAKNIGNYPTYYPTLTASAAPPLTEAGGSAPMPDSDDGALDDGGRGERPLRAERSCVR